MDKKLPLCFFYYLDKRLICYECIQETAPSPTAVTGEGLSISRVFPRPASSPATKLTKEKRSVSESHLATPDSGLDVSEKLNSSSEGSSDPSRNRPVSLEYVFKIYSRLLKGCPPNKTLQIGNVH